MRSIVKVPSKIVQDYIRYSSVLHLSDVDRICHYFIMLNRLYALAEKEAALQKNGYVPDQVYFAARDGMRLTLGELLKSLNNDELEDLLTKAVADENGQKCTPFIIAARNGHDGIVKMLLKCPVNLEQEGSVKVDNFMIEGASALWCAAGGGHLNVVKTLIRAGADPNHATLTQSTPLRAACFDGRLDIVTYLVEHGADVHKLNKYNNSCLMIAAYKGHLVIVEYLLEKGANPNQKALCGATAMHFAAECGHLDIVKVLMKHGAKMTRNLYGLTPLLAAAERTRLSVVEFLIKQDAISLHDKIDALELLGASFANDKDNYSLDFAYSFMKRAMELRFRDINNIIEKEELTPIAAYNYRTECRTLTDLERIKDNEDDLHMESLVIRERILGQHNPDVLHSIVFRGAVLADHSKFDECIALWSHALYLSQLNKMTVVKDLLRFAQLFSQMVFQEEELQFCHLKTVLTAAEVELRRNKELIESSKEDVAVMQEVMESNLLSTLYMIFILSKLKHKFDADEEYEMYQLVHRLVSVNATSSHGQSLLHLAVDAETPLDSFHIVIVCRFPCAETTKLLIKCGADVNMMDNFRNTPLHVIVGYQRPLNDFNTLHTIIMCILEAGAHPDTVNAEGKTPLEVARTGVAEIILKTQHKTTLQCITARVVNEYDIPYFGIVPKNLEGFIGLHGTKAIPIVDKVTRQPEPPQRTKPK